MNDLSTVKPLYHGAFPQPETDDSDAPYAYDAVYAVAHALHFLLETEGRTTFTGAELLRVLTQNVSFAGVTGTVEFYDAPETDRTNHGDRRAAEMFESTRAGFGVRLKPAARRRSRCLRRARHRTIVLLCTR